MSNRNTKIKSCPQVSEELVQYLEQQFPERSPSVLETTDELRHRGGQSSVVRYLREQLVRQDENFYNVHSRPKNPYI